MIDLRRLAVLREVRDRGGVTRAAKILHVSPSAVSQQLAGLARELGVPLLRQVGRGVQPTEEALILLRHADQIFTTWEEAQADLEAHRRGALGRLRLGGFATAITTVLAPSARILRERHPRLAVEVLETDAPECFIELGEGDIDIVVALAFAGLPSASDSRFDIRPLLDEPLDVVLPMGHPLAASEEVDLAHLGGFPWVLSRPGSVCYQILTVSCAAAGFQPDIRHYVDDWDALCALVAEDLGIGLIPRFAKPSWASPVVLRPLMGRSAQRRLLTVVRRGSSGAPAVLAGLDALRLVADEVQARPR